MASLETPQDANPPRRMPPPQPRRAGAMPTRRLVRRIFFGVMAALAVGSGILWATYRTLGSSLPTLQALEDARPVGATLVLAADGDTLQNFYREKRVNITLDDVPEHLRLAVLSVEDWRFYKHWGIDLWGLARAILANVRYGWGTQGASTLTQQLARNLILESHEQTLTRKVKEAMLTLRLERTYTKEEILRMYLNEIYFGDGAHGIEAAARTFFDKPTRALDVIEAATLAGLPKNPTNYSPLRHAERALKRRNVVLRTMRDHDVLTQAAYDSLVALPLLTRPGQANDETGSYVAEEVRKFLEAKYGADALYNDEMRVYTTIDRDLQRMTEAALEKRFSELEESHRLPHPRRAYLEQVAAGKEVQPLYLQAAAVALDPKTGRVLAMVGGRSFSESRFNRATQAMRQPGSCFKPLVYTAAVEKGVSPADMLLDTPMVMEMGGGRGLWKPQNYSRTFEGPVSVRYALAHSLNIPAIKVQAKVGTEAVLDTSRRMGIQSRLEPVLSLALGTSEVTLIELTAAYATLASGGIRSRPYYIERVEDRNGKTIWENAPEQQEVLDPQSAYIVTGMLQSTMDWGTGRNARVLYGLDIPVAGKTGTTDDTADGWFVGYTSDLVIGVWGGFDERKAIGLPGAGIGLPPWSDIMREWHLTHAARPFTAPPGIVTESICTESGKLGTPHCASVQPEFFTSSAAPRRECDLHSVAGDPGRKGLRTFEDATLRLDEPAPARPPSPPGN